MSETTLTMVLERELTKAGKSYVTVTSLRSGAVFRRILAITDKATPSEIAQKLRPLLPNHLVIRSGARILYLCRNVSLDSLILDKMATQKSPPGSKGILLNLPATKGEGIAALNRLLACGQLQCLLNDNHECRLLLAKAVPLVREVISQGGDKKQFYQVYQSLGGSKGRGFIFIHQIRQKLAWHRQTFDTTLLALLEEDVVEGQQGNPSQLTSGQIEDSFVDPQGRLLVTITWWGDGL